MSEIQSIILIGIIGGIVAGVISHTLELNNSIAFLLGSIGAIVLVYSMH